MGNGTMSGTQACRGSKERRGAKKERDRRKRARQSGVCRWGDKKGDKLEKEEVRHGVCGVLLSENKSLLLFYYSYMTAGIVKHT